MVKSALPQGDLLADCAPPGARATHYQLKVLITNRDTSGSTGQIELIFVEQCIYLFIN